MKTNTLLLLTVISVSSTLAMGKAPKAKMTARVVDAENGESISSAVVRTRFLVKEHWGKADEYEERKRETDMDGTCVLEGVDHSFGHGGRATLEGFYTSHFKIPYTGKSQMLNRWEPWNPTVEVKMRSKKSPVSMIQRRVESLKIPAWAELLGFDLEKGDWVVPHGKGKHPDFFVNMQRRFEHSSDYDAVAEISFPNEGDGIQLYAVPEEFNFSSYKFPYLAPTNSYQAELILERHATLRETKCSLDPKTDKYIFRVRTKTDDTGNVISACDGRMGPN